MRDHCYQTKIKSLKVHRSASDGGDDFSKDCSCLSSRPEDLHHLLAVLVIVELEAADPAEDLHFAPQCNAPLGRFPFL